ncbi:30S ribosomal protein S1 [Varanus komodoensis]|nr:30S ribosomal protein S1 [Varanus komodoensis]
MVLVGPKEMNQCHENSLKDKEITHHHIGSPNSLLENSSQLNISSNYSCLLCKAGLCKTDDCFPSHGRRILSALCLPGLCKPLFHFHPLGLICLSVFLQACFFKATCHLKNNGLTLSVAILLLLIILFILFYTLYYSFIALCAMPTDSDCLHCATSLSVLLVILQAGVGSCSACGPGCHLENLPCQLWVWPELKQGMAISFSQPILACVYHQLINEDQLWKLTKTVKLAGECSEWQASPSGGHPAAYCKTVFKSNLTTLQSMQKTRTKMCCNSAEVTKVRSLATFRIETY